MAVKLNRSAYEHAKRFIEKGQFIDDERDAWSDHHPSTPTEMNLSKRMGCLSTANGFWV